MPTDPSDLTIPKQSIKRLSSGKTLKQFHREAKAIVGRIGGERDNLRELIADYEDILQTADEAHREFEDAIDTLSRLL